MTTALAPRRTLLRCLLAAGALLFASAGHATAAQRWTLPERSVTVHHRALAYADGSLTVVGHGRLTPVAHARARPSLVGARRTRVAYANGLLTGALHHHHRRILAHAA